MTSSGWLITPARTRVIGVQETARLDCETCVVAELKRAAHDCSSNDKGEVARDMVWRLALACIGVCEAVGGTQGRQARAP
jgi:hypothetical protein